ncbi:MAG: tetratricopeptide repeat protein [Litorilituus sp.]|nr:tetratricopeptide repeat protein [Litorilituus sp.]
MSVINQMLKDLEQRAPEQGKIAVPIAHQQKSSTIKVIILSVLIILIINVLGFYIWSLNARVTSSELKAMQLQHQALNENTVVKHKIPNDVGITVAANNHRGNLNKEKENFPTTAEEISSEPVQKLKSVKVPDTKIENHVNTVGSTSLASSLATKPLSNKVQSNKPLQSQLQNVVSAKPATEVPSITINESKMTVSRRQLTPSELVAQKLHKAEKAVNRNQIATAEKLFEEVLIIEPSHKQARKKLAALWFGRKSYQQAINLLSQGISLDKQDSELRLLKARIQVQQGQHEGAYQTLHPLAHIEQQDYQVLLANVAHHIHAYESAINAYKLLIKIQPYSGKWYLGMAIIYDKNSQFILAKPAYAKALSKHDLSKTSAEFAQQRMQALGE